MAAPHCNITSAQKAASDKATLNALNGALKTGAGPVLNQLANHSYMEATKAVAPPPLQKLVTPPPIKLTKKHDLINYYLGEGLVGQQVVDALGTHGFKIKTADVSSNIKHYGTDKIPANQPKADLTAAKAKAAAAIKQAEDALKMQSGSPSTSSSKDVDAAVASVTPALNPYPGTPEYTQMLLEKGYTQQQLKQLGIQSIAKPGIPDYNVNDYGSYTAYAKQHLTQGFTKDQLYVKAATQYGQGNPALDFAKDAIEDAVVLAKTGTLDPDELLEQVKHFTDVASAKFESTQPSWLIKNAQAMGMTEAQAVALAKKTDFWDVDKDLHVEYAVKKVYGGVEGIGFDQYKAMKTGVPITSVAPSTVPPAATNVPPGKAKIIKSHADKKHDVIYKLRMAGYKGYEVVDEMSKLGYKIKLADVNANAKYYNTPKIPMSSHVANQVVIPQVTVTGTVKTSAPISTPPIQHAQPVGSVPFEKAETVMVKKLSNQLGSNPGGLYEDADGKKWYIKEYSNPLQAKNEWATNEVYRALGVQVPNTKVLQFADGRLALATGYVEQTQTLKVAGVTKQRAEAILDDFAADVLTANWDAVGLELDNVLISAGNQALRVDQGGSLLFRAKGGLKDEYALKNALEEWSNFNKSHINPAYSQVFQAAGVTDASLIRNIAEQLDRIESAWAKTGNDWRSFLKTRLPQLSSADHQKLGDILNERTTMLMKRRDAIQAAIKQKKALEDLVNLPFNESQLTHIKGLTFDNPTVMKPPAGVMTFSSTVMKPPAGVITFSSGTEWSVITHAPKVVMDAGWQGMAQWHLKYFPDLTPTEIHHLFHAYRNKYPGAIPGIVPDIHTIAGYAREALGIVKEPAPARPGFHTEIAAHKLVHPLAKQHQSVLDQNQSYAVQRYTNSSESVNNALRQKRLQGSGHEQQVENLDRVMDKSIVPDNFLTWRGVGSGSELASMSPQDLQRLVGSRIDDSGFQSWSVKYEVGTRFASSGVMLRGHLPRGSRGIYVQGTTLSSHQEFEFILARGTQWTVTKVSHNGSYYVLDVELAAQPRFDKPAAAPLSAGNWATKAPFKTMDMLIDDMHNAFGDDVDLAIFVKEKAGHAQMLNAAQNMGWSLVQWNTLKKHLKTLA